MWIHARGRGKGLVGREEVLFLFHHVAIEPIESRRGKFMVSRAGLGRMNMSQRGVACSVQHAGKIVRYTCLDAPGNGPVCGRGELSDLSAMALEGAM